MLRLGHLVLLLAACLLALGVVMVHSASMTLGGDTTLGGLLFSRPTALAVGAFACLVAGTFVPVGRLGEARGWRSPVPWIIVIAILFLVLVHVPGIGREVNGARRWVQIGAIGFQPSEIVKWGVPIVLAIYCARNAARMREFGRGFAGPLLVVATVCALIAGSDLGTALLIMLVAVAMLVVAGARIAYPLLAAPILLAGAALLVVVSPYRWNRIVAYLDPYQDREGIGYHIIQSMAAINGGELSGRGLGNSVQKFGYLPESTTDFIYAIICEELGVVGAGIIVLLYLGLIVVGLAIIRNVGRANGLEIVHPDHAPAFDAAERGIVRDDASRLLGFGVLMTIASQAAINLSVVTGLAPTKGIALPLVSHGGTGWLLTAFSLGMLAAIDRDAARAQRRADAATRSSIDPIDPIDPTPPVDPRAAPERGEGALAAIG